jgi:hypothetical protein
VWLPRTTYIRLVAEAALALHVPKLELRAEQAETTLAREREIHQQEIRHWASMFLRREKTYPLPLTPDEKTQMKAERAERAAQPPRLTEDQLARREAARQWAKTNGLTEEEADKAFMTQLATQVESD